VKTSLAPPHAARIARYRPGSSVDGVAQGKLSSNETPLGPSPATIRAIAASAPDANRYTVADALRRLLATEVGVDADQVVVTNGSDELCYLVAALFIRPGVPVVLSDPPYRINEIVSRLQEGALRFVPLRNGVHDLERMARAATDAALLWLPNPHNPTGTAVQHDGLRWLLQRVPASCIVVLDEAYRCFVDRPRRPNVHELLTDHANLLVQRTLSKSYALAGLRVGFAFGDREVIGAIDGVRPPFNVNSAALAGAAQALRDRAWSDYNVAAVRRERERFAAFLQALGVTHWPSQGNFITVRPSDSARVRSLLAERGISVRNGEELGLDGWLRITIGSPPRMALVRQVLRETEAADGR
jgi:histidinol-phosphate aminotransferase